MNEMDFTHVYNSPLGKITLASDGKNLVGLWFDDGRFFAEGLSDEVEENANLPVFDETSRWLDIYFSGKAPDFTPPFLVRGSDFRKRVCEILREIPYGKTLTYGEIAARIAKELGRKMSAQAVGGAVGHNPVSILIPCHRVVGANGNLAGYGGGMWRKIKLLELEGVDTSKFFAPEKKSLN